MNIQYSNFNSDISTQTNKPYFNNSPLNNKRGLETPKDSFEKRSVGNANINFCGFKSTLNNFKRKSLDLLFGEETILKHKIAKCIKNNDVEGVYNAVGIKTKKNEDGTLTLSEYHKPLPYASFESMGIDENSLIENVKEIEGDADFGGSKITNFGKLETIGGNANFRNMRAVNLGNIQTIGGNVDLGHTIVRTFDNLKAIGGNVYMQNSAIENLGSLETIGGSVDFYDTSVRSLGNLKSIGGDAEFNSSEVVDLGKLKTIGGNANFSSSFVQDLKRLKTVGGNLNLSLSDVVNLGNLKFVGGDFIAYDCNITDWSKVEIKGEICK